MAQIYRSPEIPRPVAVDGICKVGDLILISGSYDTFKSTFGLELVYALATGRPFLGMFDVVCDPLHGAVVQCEIDQGDYETERIRNRYPLTHNLDFLSDQQFSFNELPYLKDEFKEQGYEFVMFDPLGPMWPTVAPHTREPFDENRKTHMSPFLKRLRDLDTMLILIHHDTKGGTRSSGSSALLNDPDVRIFLDREYIAANGVDEKHLIHVTVKNRLQHPAKPFTAEFNLRTGRIVKHVVTTIHD